jgi:hypothetical protein
MMKLRREFAGASARRKLRENRFSCLLRGSANEAIEMTRRGKGSSEPHEEEPRRLADDIAAYLRQNPKQSLHRGNFADVWLQRRWKGAGRSLARLKQEGAMALRYLLDRGAIRIRQRRETEASRSAEFPHFLPVKPCGPQVAREGI